MRAASEGPARSSEPQVSPKVGAVSNSASQSAIRSSPNKQVTIWRSGLRGRVWVSAGIAVTLAIVVIFRLGIGLWFPLAPLFKLLPAWVGNSLGGVL